MVLPSLSCRQVPRLIHKFVGFSYDYITAKVSLLTRVVLLAEKLADDIKNTVY
jgi:hypothetical protein